jgi:hypothetical protein
MFGSVKNKRLQDLSASRIARAISRRIKDIPHRIAWEVDSPMMRANRQKLLQFKDRHKGERCAIVANGPSLNKTDLSLLKGVPTIGMNRIYLIRDSTGFMPTYLVVADIETKLEQFTAEFEAVQLLRFFHWNARLLFRESPSIAYFKDSYRPDFQPDFTRVIGSGKSVTYTCLQLAYFMGFSEVILIGKDHDYGLVGRPHELVESTGNEVTHFKGYHAPGMRFRVPDLFGEEYAYRLARVAFEKAGRSVIDATVGGKLDVFEKRDLDELF